MKVAIKCPHCRKKIYLKTWKENRRKAKQEKKEQTIIFSLLDTCELIHN